MISINVDMEGQRLKSSTLRAIPRAFQRNATTWASETIRYIKNELKGGAYFKRAPKELDQRLGMRVTSTGPQSAQILLGTGGVIGKTEVVYADIQERGGWIFPKKGKFLAIPLPGSKGSPRNYNIFFLRTVTGNLLACEKTGKTGRTFKARFMLVKSVKLPARHWFTRPIAKRMPELHRTMSPEGVWATAAQMAATRTAAQGGKA
jgi:hypothetical protein